jgi:hypothetical protein
MPDELYLQYDGADRGTRPLGECWNNHSIFLTGDVESPTKARANRPAEVNVRVRTRGTTTVQQVRVQAWIWKFSTTPTQSRALASFGGAAGRSALVAAVAPGHGLNDGGVATMPWTPTEDLSDVGWHVCAFANCYRDDGTEGAPLPGGTFTKPCNDPRHAQRNLNVAVTKDEDVVVGMDFGNPEPEEEQEFMLQMLEVRGRIPRAERELLVAGGYAELVWARGQRLPRLVLPGRRRVPVRRARNEAEGFLMETEQGEGRRLRVRLRGDEAQHMRVRLRLKNPKPGELSSFDVIQRTRGRRYAGGARILVLMERP